jgi:hypothetical protein
MLIDIAATDLGLRGSASRSQYGAAPTSPVVPASSRPRWCAALSSQSDRRAHGTAPHSRSGRRPNLTTPHAFAR